MAGAKLVATAEWAADAPALVLEGLDVRRDRCGGRTLAAGDAAGHISLRNIAAQRRTGSLRETNSV